MILPGLDETIPPLKRREGAKTETAGKTEPTLFFRPLEYAREPTSKNRVPPNGGHQLQVGGRRKRSSSRTNLQPEKCQDLAPPARQACRTSCPFNTKLMP